MSKKNYSVEVTEALLRQELRKMEREIASKDFAIALLKKTMCEGCKKKILNQ